MVVVFFKLPKKNEKSNLGNLSRFKNFLAVKKKYLNCFIFNLVKNRYN